MSRDEAQVRTLIDRIADQSGGLHVLVNNAGIIDDQLVALTSLARWERVLRVNLTGPFLTSRAVLPIMLEQSWGRIINLSSNSVRIPGAGQAAYAASKGAWKRSPARWPWRWGAREFESTPWPLGG